MTIANKTLRLFKKIIKLVAPPPQLKVSEWADCYRRLSSESSAEPGQWRTDRAPYQREVMNAINDPSVETVVWKSSAQVGKTEFILNVIGYFIDYDPAPIMLVQPTLELAQAFSKDRLAPMLRDTPALRGKVRDVKSKDSGNTLLHKSFPGGHITMAGANSPASLASRPIRIALMDEVDRYPVSAGTEGDPVTLVSKRTTTFWNRKKILVSTPTVKGASRIESAYEESTMEQWCLPCPECGEYQPLSWEQIDQETATHRCKECGFSNDEYAWKNCTGKWIAQNAESKVRGFHLNELASPWKTWKNVIDDYHDAVKGGVETLKAWWNTSLGETWEEAGEQINENTLFQRKDAYHCEVPDGVLLLTAGVDVQKDRLEVEVVGWGKGKESWGIEYRRIYGDPKQPKVWKELDEYLSYPWKKESGQKMVVACTGIDSGYLSTDVYRYCKKREHRNIFAIKGKAGPEPIVGRITRTPREKCALFIVGVDTAKGILMERLQQEETGPDYCHFPAEDNRGYDDEYFRGLSSEKKVIKNVKGRPKIEWVKANSARNEPIDLRNYATAAMEIVNPNYEQLALQAEKYRVGQSKVNAEPVRKRRIISKGL